MRYECCLRTRHLRSSAAARASQASPLNSVTRLAPDSGVGLPCAQGSLVAGSADGGVDDGGGSQCSLELPMITVRLPVPPAGP